MYFVCIYMFVCMCVRSSRPARSGLGARGRRPPGLTGAAFVKLYISLSLSPFHPFTLSPFSPFDPLSLSLPLIRVTLLGFPFPALPNTSLLPFSLHLTPHPSHLAVRSFGSVTLITLITLISVAFLMVMTRFKHKEPMRGYVERYLRVVFSVFMKQMQARSLGHFHNETPLALAPLQPASPAPTSSAHHAPQRAASPRPRQLEGGGMGGVDDDGGGVLEIALKLATLGHAWLRQVGDQDLFVCKPFFLCCNLFV